MGDPLTGVTAARGARPAPIFVTGGSGYIGRATVSDLVARGHSVRVLVRPGSERHVPPGAEAVRGDALDGSTFRRHVGRDDVFIQLVGTPRPSPRKAAEFERVDLVSVRESVLVAESRPVAHFVYLSVAQPAPVMHAYVAVRARGEEMIRASGLPHTILRPWYVLGRGHRWPLLLVPLYRLAELLPDSRETARRLGLLTLEQMVGAIVSAVESPPEAGGVILDVPAMKRAAARLNAGAGHAG